MPTSRSAQTTHLKVRQKGRLCSIEALCGFGLRSRGNDLPDESTTQQGDTVFYVQQNLKRGSQRWSQWRKSVVGASEASSIMGENPWRSAESLKREKLGSGKPFQHNVSTRESERLLPEARSAVERYHSTKIRPMVIQDGELPYLAASLDGMSDDHKAAYVIKCGRSCYERTKVTSKPPPYYAAQLQHILMITGLDEIYFIAYRPKLRLMVLTVKRRESYIKKLRKAEERFARELERNGLTIRNEFTGRAARLDT